LTPKMFVQKLDRYSRIKSLKNIAIVLNGAKGKGFKKYDDSYSYGYNYVESRKGKRAKGLSKTL